MKKGNTKQSGWVVQKAVDMKVTSGIVYREPDFAKHGGILPVTLVDPDLYTPERAWAIVLGIVNTKKAQFWETVYTNEAVFYSKSRNCRWKKGEKESGNILLLREIHINCYGDSLMYIVKQTKPEAGFCHTGSPTCFSPIISAVLEQKGNTTFKVLPLS